MYKYGSYEYIALKDYERSKANMKINEYQVVCIYAQQCIEKFFKAEIEFKFAGYIKRDDSIFKTHKLKLLYNKLEISSLTESMKLMGDITNLYFDSRYPGDEYCDCSENEAEIAISVMTAVYDWFTELHPIPKTE